MDVLGFGGRTDNSSVTSLPLAIRAAGPAPPYSWEEMAQRSNRAEVPERVELGSDPRVLVPRDNKETYYSEPNTLSKRKKFLSS